VCDLLHYGHLQFLKMCRKYCDYMVVGVYTDELAASYKRTPVIPFEERIALVRELRCVDEVRKVVNKDATPMLKRLVEEGYNVKYLFHGDDWEKVEGEEFIKSIGGSLIQFPYYPYRSTSNIIEKIMGSTQ